MKRYNDTRKHGLTSATLSSANKRTGARGLKRTVSSTSRSSSIRTRAIPSTDTVVTANTELGTDLYFEAIESRLQSETSLITDIVKERLDPMQSDIKKMLESHVVSVNNLINTSLESQKYIFEKQHEVSREKYKTLVKNYRALQSERIADFQRYSDTIGKYQEIVLRMTSKLFATTSNTVFNDEEAAVLTKLLDKLSEDNKNIKSETKPRSTICLGNVLSDSDSDSISESYNDVSTLSQRKHLPKSSSVKQITNPIINRTFSTTSVTKTPRPISETLDSNIADIMNE